MTTERRYSEQEVRAILERALRHDHADGLSHTDLLDAAGEAGISRDAVEQAALEVEATRGLELARERIIARRRAAFFSHLWAYVGVQVFLIAINLITGPEYLWFVFPLLGWGLGLFFSARQGLSKEVSERQLQREVARSPASPRRVAAALPDRSRQMGRGVDAPRRRAPESSDLGEEAEDDTTGTADAEAQRGRT
jgi:hypothetical protein